MGIIESVLLITMLAITIRPALDNRLYGNISIASLLGLPVIALANYLYKLILVFRSYLNAITSIPLHPFVYIQRGNSYSFFYSVGKPFGTTSQTLKVITLTLMAPKVCGR